MVKAKAAEAAENNILPFLKPDGGGPKDNDWLRELKLGTVFLAKPKASAGFILQEFMRGGELPDTEYIFVVENPPAGPPNHIWVESKGFSKAFKMVHIRQEGQDNESSVP